MPSVELSRVGEVVGSKRLKNKGRPGRAPSGSDLEACHEIVQIDRQACQLLTGCTGLVRTR